MTFFRGLVGGVPIGEWELCLMGTGTYDVLGGKEVQALSWGIAGVVVVDVNVGIDAVRGLVVRDRSDWLR